MLSLEFFTIVAKVLCLMHIPVVKCPAMTPFDCLLIVNMMSIDDVCLFLVGPCCTKKRKQTNISNFRIRDMASASKYYQVYSMWHMNSH